MTRRDRSAGVTAGRHPRGSVEHAGIDLEGLLAALVLVPHSYPRNRFHQLYRDPAAARVRRRAALLRSVIADLACDASDLSWKSTRKGTLLRYELAELGVRRCTYLGDTELPLVKLCLLRAEAAGRIAEIEPLRSVDAVALDDVVRRLERLMDGT